MTDRIRLETGRLALEIAPAIGGSIAHFERRVSDDWAPIFRKTKSDYTAPLEAALFPLVPFANRIRGGSFVCDGRTIALPANMPGDKSPIHGQGWQNPWIVARRDSASVTLNYRHEADAWPWTYDAQLTYEIDETRLRVTLTCANRSPEPMPCALGLHPYYDCDDSTLLSTISVRRLDGRRRCAAGKGGARHRPLRSRRRDRYVVARSTTAMTAGAARR